MRKTDIRPKMRSIMMLVCAMLAVLLGSCACSPSEPDEEPPTSDSNEASNRRITLNDNTSDAPVPLEEVSVVVYNASQPTDITAEADRSIEGLAEHGARRLKDMGVERTTAKNAATTGPLVSYIVYRSPKYEQAALKIAEGLGIEGAIHETGENSANGYYYDGDVGVILCEDWAFSEGLIDELSEKAQQAINDQKTILGS